MKTTTETERSPIYSLIISGFLLVLGFLPLTWCFSVLTHAWRAHLYLGHWPYYNNPDPKTLPEHFHPQTEVLEYIVPWVALAICVGLGLWIVHLVKDSKRRMLVASFLFVFGWLSSFAVLYFDPGGFFEWILD